MELRQYWRIVQKSIWLILLVVAISLGIATYMTTNQRPFYESSSTLLLNPSVPSTLLPDVRNQAAATLAASYTELIHTRSFAEAVAREVPFPMQPGQVASVSTRLAPNTLFYKISAVMETPQKAQQLTTAVIKVFLSTLAVNAAQQQDELNQGGDNMRGQMHDLLQEKLQYLEDQVKSTQDEIDRLQSQEAPSKDRDDRVFDLRNQLVGMQEAEVNAMVALAQIGDSKDSVAPNTARVIDPPSPGRRMASANLFNNLSMALAGSLLAGIALAFLRDYLDATIHAPEHVESLLGVAPVAAIGVIGQTRKRVLSQGIQKLLKRPMAPDRESVEKRTAYTLVTLDHPNSAEAESFRVLRTSILFSSMEKPIHSLVVTSAGPAEGKSFIASNLAIVMAQAGKRVILVDADIRRPTLHKQFNLPNAIGFTGLVLNQGADVSSVVQVVPEVDNLMVITSGPQPLRPAELFTSDRLVQVMAQIAEQADIVIYDTPPVGVVTDAVMLASRVDAVVLVVGAGVSRKGMIMQMRQGLQTARVTTLLPVINGVKDKDLQGYSYHYYYYHDYHRYFEDVVLGESETPRTNGRSLPVTALSTGDPVSQADPGALNGGSSQPQQRTGRYRHPSSGPN